MEKNTILYQTKKCKQSGNKQASNQHLYYVMPHRHKSCWQALFKLNLSCRLRNIHPQALVKLNFTCGGESHQFNAFVLPSKTLLKISPQYYGNLAILWKSSVVQKTLAALPITCLKKPDDAPMEKMLWISTTGNPTTIINQCESHQLPSYLSMGVSALMAYQRFEGPIGLGF